MELSDCTLRFAREDDVDAVVALKESLAMSVDPGTTFEGGFVLGSSRDRYLDYARVDGLLVVTVDQEIVAYATMLDDEALRAADVWARRGEVVWSSDVDASILESSRIGYFDQLAVHRSHQSNQVGTLLALGVLITLISRGHAFVLTTTLVQPVENRAALPLIERIGGVHIGEISEDYPGVGHVRSAVHLLAAAPALAILREKQLSGAPRERALITHCRGQLAIDV